jgi:hypothetical protein
MKKIKLDVDALDVESFEPSEAKGERGTVKGLLTAYYELCHEGDTWQGSCTCEPTCNADTCYNCQSAGCTPACPLTQGSTCGERTCTGMCCLMYDTIASPDC